MNNARVPNAAVCVTNVGNEASLQLWKIYKTLRDEDAESEGFIRVIDESGEDYLFPKENFVPITLPAGVRRPFERAIREQRRSTFDATISRSRSTRRVSPVKSNHGGRTVKGA